MALCFVLACDSRPSAPAVPATMPSIVPVRQFPDTPEGAAREFLTAWINSDHEAMQQIILPNPDASILFAMGWIPPARRTEFLSRIKTEPVREFHSGDQYPYGLPGQPKEMRTVPPGLDADHRLVMLAERGMNVVRTPQGWRIDASKIIESLRNSARVIPPKPATQPAVPPARRPATTTTAPVDFRL